jgi:hypothetical protein
LIVRKPRGKATINYDKMENQTYLPSRSLSSQL